MISLEEPSEALTKFKVLGTWKCYRVTRCAQLYLRLTLMETTAGLALTRLEPDARVA